MRLFTRCFLLLSLLLVTLPAVRAQVTLTTDLMASPDVSHPDFDLQNLHDVVRVQAKADSPAGIARVLFEVDDQFRAEIKKPPYTLDWDTLDEQDGAHTLAVTAYNMNGQTAVKRIKVRVDNQLGLGIRHYLETGFAAFRAGDIDTLHSAARKAQRISRQDVDSLRLNALDTGVRGDPNRGLQTLDNAQNNIPKDQSATLRVRGFLLLMRALSAPDAGAMVADLQTAFPLLRRQAADFLVAQKATNGKPTFASALAAGDAAFTLNNVSGALTSWQDANKLTTKPVEKRRAGLRIGLALLHLGRLQEAEDTALKLNSGSEATPTCAALLGAVRFHRRLYTAARKCVEEGFTRRNPASLVVATLADLALNQRPQAYADARAAVNAADTAETQYAALAAIADAGEGQAARRTFRVIMLRTPLFTPAIVERAYEVAAYERGDARWTQALTLFDAVLSTEPENTSALTGRIAALIRLHRLKAAQQQLVHLAALDPASADLTLLRAASVMKDRFGDHNTMLALAQAKSLDPVNFQDAYMPDMDSLVTRLIRLRRTVPLTPALLDLSDGVSP